MNWFPIAALPIVAVLFVAMAMLSGCAHWERDPLAAYHGAPGAYEFPMTTFAVVSF